MSKSKIEWTETTWNPVTGCNKVSPGCKNCYAERMAKRLKAMRNPNYRNGFQVTTHEHMLDRPLRWRKPQRIFVNSMSDLFHPDVPFQFIEKVFDVMRQAHWHQFQVLTKRPERMADFMQTRTTTDIPPNIWLGTSVENRKYMHRIDTLRNITAAVRFLSLRTTARRPRTIEPERNTLGHRRRRIRTRRKTNPRRMGAKHQRAMSSRKSPVLLQTMGRRKQKINRTQINEPNMGPNAKTIRKIKHNHPDISPIQQLHLHNLLIRKTPTPPHGIHQTKKKQNAKTRTHFLRLVRSRRNVLRNVHSARHQTRFRHIRRNLGKRVGCHYRRNIHRRRSRLDNERILTTNTRKTRRQLRRKNRSTHQPDHHGNHLSATIHDKQRNHANGALWIRHLLLLRRNSTRNHRRNHHQMVPEKTRHRNEHSRIRRFNRRTTLDPVSHRTHGRNKLAHHMDSIRNHRTRTRNTGHMANHSQ